MDGCNEINHVKEDFKFVALLKACAKKKNLYEGTKLHGDILKKRGLLEKSPYLACTLISMYAKCGMIAKAQAVLDHLPYRNVVCWNALISGYAHQGLGHEALVCFSQMRKEGFLPNVVTFLCVLKACGSIGAIDRGEKIHDEIVEKGLLARNVALGTSLVDMYAKCGMVRKAEVMHGKLCVRDVVSWTALIAGYAQQDQGHEALKCFEEMKSDGVSPNSITFTFALKACSSCGDIAKGKQIHDEIASRGFLERDIMLATALVDMYAKCGVFAKAREVLREIPIRNVITWNALIAGYTYYGHGHEAFNCLEQMQSEGLSPDVVTFISILKACGTIGAVDIGKQIHNEIVSKGLMNASPALGNSLMDMYARCCRLIEAQQVHDHLHIRDVVSWSTLIAGYVQQGQDYEALNCFESMQGENVDPNAVTFAYILKACGSIGVIDKGKQIHDEIVSRAMLGNDVVLGNSLVDMYAKCGYLAKAKQVFEELPARDVVSWTTLIAGYAQQGEFHEAMNCLERMEDEEISPNAATYAGILKACASARAINEGKQIHIEIIHRSLFQKDIVVGNALVDMYAKCGLLTEAHCVLEELPLRDVVSWSAIISGYAEQEQGHEALNCFEQMQCEGISPNVVTFICILKACGSTRDINKGEQIHDEIFSKGLLKKNTVIGTALVDMYAKCGSLVKAHQVHDELCVRDVVSWNALISGYAEHGRSHEALDCFEQMQNEGFSPDASTFICILKACSNVGSIRIGEQIHNQIVIKGLLEKDVVLSTALIDMYAKCDVLPKAQQMHDTLCSHDVVSWSALIAGYAQQGRGNEALYYFEWMQVEGLSPNLITLISILNVCGSIGAIEKGEEIHAYILNNSLLLGDISLGNALVDMYAKCGSLAKAKQVLEELPVRNVITWSSLIAGYAQQRLGHEALTAFEQMQLDGVSPDAITLLCLLNACCQSGLLDEAQMYYENMSQRFGITPNVEHHTCMVTVFGCGGLFDKAVSIIKVMTPSHDYLPVWLGLLGACKKWGNVKLGRLAFEQATHIDNDCASAYALMANIYIAAGMAEDAKKVEAKRLENTSKKRKYVG